MVAVGRVRHFGTVCGEGTVKAIHHTSTLLYYDGVQVFEARDAIGGHYIAFLVPSTKTDNQYLVGGVEPEKLRQFRSGVLDLRSLFESSDADDRYLAVVEEGLNEPLALRRLSEALDEGALLPEEGFVLHDHPTDDYVLREARERNNFILELAADPPEAASQHRIRANTLAQMLFHIQNMVKHAHSMAIKGRPIDDRPSGADTLDVIVPAASGSFRIVLAAANLPDLFGGSDLGRALEYVDALFKNTASPEETLSTVLESRGHLAGTYLNLLRFLVECETGLRYSWADPRSERPSRRAVSQVEAKYLVEALSTVTDLGTETVRLEGTFERFNRGSGTWGLLTSQGSRRGRVGKGGPSLDGLEVGARYIFHCEETIEEVDITGRESRTLYLNLHERA